jgi:hypothetical protein
MQRERIQSKGMQMAEVKRVEMQGYRGKVYRVQAGMQRAWG